MLEQLFRVDHGVSVNRRPLREELSNTLGLVRPMNRTRYARTHERVQIRPFVAQRLYQLDFLGAPTPRL